MMQLSHMDYERGALWNAAIEDMDLYDVLRCAEHAQTADDFDEAVNILAQTMDDTEIIDIQPMPGFMFLGWFQR